MIAVFVVLVEKSVLRRENMVLSVHFERDLWIFDKMVNYFQFCV